MIKDLVRKNKNLIMGIIKKNLLNMIKLQKLLNKNKLINLNKINNVFYFIYLKIIIFVILEFSVEKMIETC